MPNPYTTMTARLRTELQAGLIAAGYVGAEARRGIWNPGTLTPWTRYLVFVAPPTGNPWEERRIITPRQVSFVLRAELFLLVKNYNEEQSVFGDTAPNFGVFQMIHDVKGLLRNTDLNGLVDRTYRETEGGSAFETGAAVGFDAGTHGWVHRAKLVYTAYTQPFCHP